MTERLNGWQDLAPLDSDARAFLVGYLSRLRERVTPCLSPRRLKCFDRLLDAGGANSLIDRADFSFTCLNFVAAATKPPD